jgi:hypothetical protein
MKRVKNKVGRHKHKRIYQIIGPKFMERVSEFVFLTLFFQVLLPILLPKIRSSAPDIFLLCMLYIFFGVLGHWTAKLICDMEKEAHATVINQRRDLSPSELKDAILKQLEDLVAFRDEYRKIPYLCFGWIVLFFIVVIATVYIYVRRMV